MRELYRNIFLGLLLITGLVILSHSVIPHDHHYEVACETEHYENHNESSDNDPIHCHFFNDIVIEKVTVSFNKNIVNQLLSVYVVLIIDDINDSFEINKTFNIDYFLPDNKVNIENSPTRGSPNHIILG